MVYYFPTPYPEEIFYSVLARYCKHTNERAYTANTKLFSNGLVQLSIEFPTHLESLKANTKGTLSLKPIDIIERHSLLPFFRKFCDPVKLPKAVDRMMIGKGLIKSSLGINQCSLPALRMPKYCFLCAEYDLKLYGEIFWRREHQLPSQVCRAHKTYLQIFKPHITSAGYLSYQFAESLQELDSNSVVCTNPLQLQIAEYCYKLLITESSIERSKDFYTKELASRGYVVGKRENITTLINDVRKTFGTENVDDFIRKNSNLSVERFFQALIYKPNKILNPVRHLALHHFLSITPFKRNAQPQFGNGPWKCLNKASDHYLEPIISEFQIEYSDRSRQNVASFKCSCGMVYKQYLEYKFGPIANAKLKTKVVNFGKIWEEKAEQLLNERKSFASIARALGVSETKIKLYAKRLIVPKMPRRKTVTEAEVDHNRAVYLSHLLRSEYETPTKLRKSFPNLYNWIYRHDRDWLLAINLTYGYKREKLQTRLDWEAYDQQTLKIVREKVIELKREKFGKRISSSVIFRSLYQTRYFSIRRMGDKIPHTLAYVKRVQETTEDFNKRINIS